MVPLTLYLTEKRVKLFTPLVGDMLMKSFWQVIMYCVKNQNTTWKSLQTYWKPLKYVSEFEPIQLLEFGTYHTSFRQTRMNLPFFFVPIWYSKSVRLEKKKVKMFFPFLSQCLDIIWEGFFSWYAKKIFDIANVTVTPIWGLLIREFLVMTSLFCSSMIC